MPMIILQMLARLNRLCDSPLKIKLWTSVSNKLQINVKPIISKFEIIYKPIPAAQDQTARCSFLRWPMRMPANPQRIMKSCCKTTVRKSNVPMLSKLKPSDFSISSKVWRLENPTWVTIVQKMRTTRLKISAIELAIIFESSNCRFMTGKVWVR